MWSARSASSIARPLQHITASARESADIGQPCQRFDAGVASDGERQAAVPIVDGHDVFERLEGFLEPLDDSALSQRELRTLLRPGFERESQHGGFVAARRRTASLSSLALSRPSGTVPRELPLPDDCLGPSVEDLSDCLIDRASAGVDPQANVCEIQAEFGVEMSPYLEDMLVAMGVAGRGQFNVRR